MMIPDLFTAWSGAVLMQATSGTEGGDVVFSVLLRQKEAFHRLPT
jgi:hypothetical protein